MNSISQTRNTHKKKTQLNQHRSKSNSDILLFQCSLYFLFMSACLTLQFSHVCMSHYLHLHLPVMCVCFYPFFFIFGGVHIYISFMFMQCVRLCKILIHMSKSPAHTPSCRIYTCLQAWAASYLRMSQCVNLLCMHSPAINIQSFPSGTFSEVSEP